MFFCDLFLVLQALLLLFCGLVLALLKPKRVFKGHLLTRCQELTSRPTAHLWIELSCPAGVCLRVGGRFLKEQALGEQELRMQESLLLQKREKASGLFTGPETEKEERWGWEVQKRNPIS